MGCSMQGISAGTPLVIACARVPAAVPASLPGACMSPFSPWLSSSFPPAWLLVSHLLQPALSHPNLPCSSWDRSRLQCSPQLGGEQG